MPLHMSRSTLATASIVKLRRMDPLPNAVLASLFPWLQYSLQNEKAGSGPSGEGNHLVISEKIALHGGGLQLESRYIHTP